MNHGVRLLLLIAIATLAGCASFATTNKPLPNNPPSATVPPVKASYTITQDRGTHEKTLMLLAISGGGSRAAYWSGAIMLELEKVFQEQHLNLLQEVDLMSSVSGGSLPAAYYAVSYDDDAPDRPTGGRKWNEEDVKDLMSRKYLSRWFGNWFWPTNVARYWFTAYDRSDIMAQTLADNLFDNSISGHDFTIGDLNPARPNLILNATNGTRGDFGKLFAFTDEQFAALCSDIKNYSLARAVMATASFPAVFNYMTLRNYKVNNQCVQDNDRFVHVFDGGNYDNLGLSSIERAIHTNENTFRAADGKLRVVVILIDAYTPSKGVSSSQEDARSPFEYAVDLNFLDSTDSLLSKVREEKINDMKTLLGSFDADKTVFYHIRLQDPPDSKITRVLNAIPTSFNIKSEDTAAIDKAVKLIITQDNTCLQKIRDIVLQGRSANTTTYCSWPGSN